MYYKPVKCQNKVPLKKMPQDILKDLKWWYVDNDTGEAVMEDQNDQVLLKVYDYMHFANLFKDDLLKLHTNKILFIDFWRHEGRRYKRVVIVCVDKGLHAGSELYNLRTFEDI